MFVVNTTYHSDHLGSATWITDASSDVVQYLHYLPYGEIWRNQQRVGYDERFKFTGKERDSETGYDYFGKRYYDSRALTSWLSVDPLADKYPNISSYAYCTWNPIKLYDPDGRDAKLSVNKNVITIKANYYARKSDIKSASLAVQFWNNQRALKYTDKKGKTYSINFDLKVIQSSGNPKNDVVLSHNSYSNSYEIVNDIGTTPEGNVITGQTKYNHNINVKNSHDETLTGAHEVGHTLMNISGDPDVEHSASGVMTSYGNSEERNAVVSQETVNNIVESNGFNQNNQTLWKQIKSVFE